MNNIINRIQFEIKMNNNIKKNFFSDAKELLVFALCLFCFNDGSAAATWTKPDDHVLRHDLRYFKQKQEHLSEFTWSMSQISLHFSHLEIVQNMKCSLLIFLFQFYLKESHISSLRHLHPSRLICAFFNEILLTLMVYNMVYKWVHHHVWS